MTALFVSGDDLAAIRRRRAHQKVGKHMERVTSELKCLRCCTIQVRDFYKLILLCV